MYLHKNHALGHDFLLIINLNIKIKSRFAYIIYINNIYLISTKRLYLRIVNNIYVKTQFHKIKILYISVREMQISIQGK